MKRSVCWMMTMVVVLIVQISATFAAGEQPPGPPILPQISANPSILPADGVSTSLITVISNDKQGNPMSNVSVFFNLTPEVIGNISTAFGYVEGKGWLNLTDSNGKAIAIFTAGKRGGEANVGVQVGDFHNNTLLKLEDRTLPVISQAYASPGEILLNEASNADSQITTRLNVTATDASGIASVTIDLSLIGGNADAVMTIAGNNVYSITINAAGSPCSKSLRVNATDIYGNSNTGVSITLSVVKNGDVNSDGVTDVADAMWLANNIAGTPGFGTTNELASEVNGDGIIDVADAMYIANYIAGTQRFDKLY